MRAAEEQLELEEDAGKRPAALPTLTQDHLRVVELLRRIAREWSAEGAAERKQSFGLLGSNALRFPLFPKLFILWTSFRWPNSWS